MPEIVLYGVPGAWSLPSLSPFVLKLDAWLRLAGTPYTVRRGNPRKAPRGKVPYARIDGVVLSDSQEILEHLAARLGDPVDGHLDAAGRARGHLVRRMLEEGTMWAIVRDRWIEEPGWSVYAPVFGQMFPSLLRPLLLWFVRNRTVRPMLHAQGTGRLPVEVMVANVASDLRAVATLLGDAPFLGGERPCTADVTLLAVSWSLEAVPTDTALRRVWSGEPAIVAHLQRMRARLYPEPTSPEHGAEGPGGPQ